MKTNTSTIQSRRALVQKVLHENYLEGNEPNQELRSLIEQFVEGNISAREIATAITSRKSKVA